MLSIANCLGIAFAGVVLVQICISIYFLYFHPLSGIPGPTLAAATQWYEFYYDVLKWPGGQYSWEVDKMHEQYGECNSISVQAVNGNMSSW
jgi:hypothetical protein